MPSQLVTCCIFVFGLFNSIPTYLMLMATEDIVAGTLIQSSVVMSLFSTGDLLGMLFVPFLVRLIRLPMTAMLSCLMCLASWLLVSFGEDVYTRLVGSFIVGLTKGLPNVIGLWVLSLYDETERNTSAFIAGGNIATFPVGFLYTGSTVWMCLPPRLTFSIVFPLTVVQFVIYAILNHGPLKKYQNRDVNHKYRKLNDSKNPGTKSTMNQMYDHLKFLCTILPFASYQFEDTFLYRLAATSAITTLTFPSAPFRIRDHFQYYTYTSDIGRTLGGLAVLLVSVFRPSWINWFRFRQILILVSLSFCHLLFFLSATWYRFVPNVYIVLTLCLTHGILLAVIYCLVLSSSGKLYSSSHNKGLTLNICQMGGSIGVLFAGLFGFYVEEYLHQQCTSDLLLGKFCLARFTSNLGWSKNSQCT